jgi:predicted nuclease of restriction endonuclease-like (RecB) superfamily
MPPHCEQSGIHINESDSMNKKNSIKKIDNLEFKNYAQFLEYVKKDIQQTQLRAAQSITTEITLLYWRIGKHLSQKSKTAVWGAKIAEKLAHDLEISFPGIAGFSLRNLKYMQKFAVAYPDPISATAVALIPWGHNITILEKIKKHDLRIWYAKKTMENGWSRSVLTMWIESELHKRQGKSITNFKTTLINPLSDLAEQTLKDPYNFDFLTMNQEAKEREIEQGLTEHIQKFLIELGQGFAFIGRQYHLVVGSKDLYIDMLFYHLKLRCFIVVELKAQEFDARDLGQINLYLSAVDSLLSHPGDQPTIGLLLCKSKDNYIAEYALRDINKPIGISSYTTKLVESLPKEYKGKLPSIKDIEAELDKKNETIEPTKPVVKSRKLKK